MSHSEPSVETASTRYLLQTVDSVSATDGADRADRPYTFQSEPTAAEIHKIVSGCETYPQLLSQLADLVARRTSLLGLWFSEVQNGEPSSPSPLIDKTEDTLGGLEISNITWMARSSIHQQELIYHRSVQIPSIQFVACPVYSGQTICGSLVGCFSTENDSAQHHYWIMTLVCRSISSWIQQLAHQQSHSTINRLNDALSLVQSLDTTDSVGSTGRALVNHIQRITPGQKVAFAYRNPYRSQHRDGAELVAVSGVEQLDLAAPVNQSILNCCQQTMDAGRTLTSFPTDTQSTSEVEPALEQYVRTSRLESCITIPIGSKNDEPNACLLIAGDQHQLSQPKLIEHLETVCQMIAGHFDIVVRANLGPAQRLRNAIASKIRQNLGKKLTWAVAAAIAILFVPWPYHVSCDCQLEPVVRRFVAAPYDGILEKTLAKSGEVVTAEQLLATMDGRALRIQLAGLEAELDGARKRRDTALAERDIAQSQIAKSEMKRHQAEIQLLNRKLENLDVRSPIDGIIVSGDLETVEGAPLETGQTMFEVGPLDQMVAEIQVPESEIRFIEEGQKVKIKLEAFPFRAFHGTVKRIHTRAEIVADSNVFIAEVVMDNQDSRLKPGMAGCARISSGTYPLGWNLFHGAWDKVRYWSMW